MHRPTCRPGSFVLPFLPQPFCPTITVRREHTRDRLSKQCNTGGTLICSSRSRTAVDSLTVVGKKLHVGSEELPLCRTRRGRLAAFDHELPASPYADHCDSAAKFHRNSPIQAANTDTHCNCYESCSRMPDTRTTDERLFVDDRHSTSQPHPSRTGRQQASFLSELEKADECSETNEVEPQIFDNSGGSYRNVRVDQNRLLKLLRKFDTIRRRARAAKEACHLRLEMRQKQRLNLVDYEYQQKDAGQEVVSNDSLPPLESDERAALRDIEVQGGRKFDVKLRDIIDLYGPASSDNVTTWPPMIGDASTSTEPPDAVINRLMSEFEHIRLDSVAARLDNQKRFENKRKLRKYKI